MKNEGVEGTERFLSPDKGRGLRALRHFAVGELVFACPAYSYVLTVNERAAHCEYCFTRKEGLSKCGKCKQAFYCDVDCQRASTERTPSERLLLLTEFESHLDKLDSEKEEMNQSDIAALHHFYSKHIIELPDNPALIELFGQVNCNGFTIEDEELSHLGSAVFPDVALMNHSCSPNVIVTYNGTVAEVRAVQDINPGDEVFNSYIDLLYPTEDRRERLIDSYFFNCQCEQCTSKSKDKAKMEIKKKLSSPPEPEEIRAMVHYAKNMCELSQEKMGSIFADTNVYMLHMMYQAMGVCLYMQDWDGAMSYGEKIVQPYSMHYPAYSLNVASMYLKLGRLYLGLERKTQGVKALKKAQSIMEVAHGKDHHYVAEVKREIEEQKKEV
ncbi:hypothetical protein CRUP_022334 [Coryphaenoides rupestris]|nr:hypothetical protein CRUP_022334 [Coryphaenoides rupestris]